MGVYVKRCQLPIYVVVDRMFIINTNTVKHTHYVVIWIDFRCMWQESKKNKYLKESRWQLRIFESVFYKSLIRACSFGNSLAASQNARSNGQTSNHRHCEFVKNALKKCSCLPPWFFQIFVFLLFLSHTPEVYSNYHTVCMLNGIGRWFLYLLPEDERCLNKNQFVEMFRSIINTYLLSWKN